MFDLYLVQQSNVAGIFTMKGSMYECSLLDKADVPPRPWVCWLENVACCSWWLSSHLLVDFVETSKGETGEQNNPKKKGSPSTPPIYSFSKVYNSFCHFEELEPVETSNQQKPWKVLNFETFITGVTNRDVKFSRSLSNA